jgi:tetratricopeptide (TPR) repeat protein
LRENGFRRAAEICDENRVNAREPVTWAIHCGSAYGRLGRLADAELAYRSATGPLDSRSYAHMNLAILYLHMGRKAEARAHFETAIAEERTLFLREYFSGLMLIQLHPENRQLLLEAKAHLERALELQPQHVESRRELESLNSRLGSTSG